MAARPPTAGHVSLQSSLYNPMALLGPPHLLQGVTVDSEREVESDRWKNNERGGW